VYKLYFELLITFFKIGLFTIGGGYAMIPLIQQEPLNSMCLVIVLRNRCIVIIHDLTYQSYTLDIAGRGKFIGYSKNEPGSKQFNSPFGLFNQLLLSTLTYRLKNKKTVPH